MKAIYFDMDGTIANLYAYPSWLEQLRAFNPVPYVTASPMVNMSAFARQLHRLQRNGYHIGIVSWLSKETTSKYDLEVTSAKEKWLKAHLPSVSFDEYHFLPYGTPKQKSVKHPEGILFDDEKRNRDNWRGIAFDETNILEILRGL